MLLSISGRIGSGKDTFANLLALAIYNQELEGTSQKLLDPNVVITYKEIYKRLGIEIHKFADALKDIVCRLTGCTREQLEDQDFKNSVMPEEWWYIIEPKTTTNGNTVSGKAARTYREFLQEFGTNVLRNWIPNIHVNATFSTWKPVPVPMKDTKITGWGKKVGALVIQQQEWPKWIITDMRFPNELVGVKERDGIVIRINRYPTKLTQSRAAGDTPIEIPFDPTNKQHMDLWKGECMRAHESETALDDYQNWDVVVDNNGTIEDLYQQAVQIVKQFKLT